MVYIYMNIYIYIYICLHLTQAGATVAQAWLVQLHKLDGCTLCRMVFSSAAAEHTLQWFPPLCSVSSAGGLQPVDRLLT